jgi:hypothetical protein
MKLPSLLTILALVVSLPAHAAPAKHARSAAASSQTPSSDPFPNKSIIVYVADFDLGASNVPGPVRAPNRRPITLSPTSAAVATGAPPSGAAAPVPTANPPATNPATGATGADGQAAEGEKSTALRADAPAVDAQKSETPESDTPQDDSPRARAAKLVQLTSTTLVKVLEQAGYTVRRWRGSAALPENGVILRGVFAQVDPNAGLRRAVFGGPATDPKMLLFIGVGNLARPEQTLYQVVGPQPVGNIGPLISVSAYAPVSRYELARDPSEDELRNIAGQISVDLTRVLNANPLAVGE